MTGTEPYPATKPSGVPRLTRTLLATLTLGIMTLHGTAHAQKSKQPSLSDAPPTLTALTLTPAGSTSARLFVRFQPDQRLTSTLTINAGDTPVKLKRSADGTPSYSGQIPFDFNGFEDEQAQRQQQNDAGVTVPVFLVRELETREPIPFIDPALIARAVQSQTPLDIIPGSNLAGPAVVKPEQELFVTDTSVVTDPIRTFDPCTGAGNGTGAWTFGTLMTAMANQPLTAVDPALFVETWLKRWTVNQVINTWTVAKRPAISNTSNLLGFWPRLADGRLDLTRSPLTLIAIVNRVDLRNNAVYGGGNAGEGRFIFQVVRPPSAATGFMCLKQPFTVILEYGVPITGCTPVHDWAAKWHALSAIGFSPSYNAALQSITDVFATANANSAKENGSALKQLRTDEVQLAKPWQLRQFELGNKPHSIPFDNQLHESTVTQTPDTTLNFTATVANYLGTLAPPPAFYQVPLKFPAGVKFLGGASDNLNQPWDGSPSVPTDTRNNFSLNTCNACHGAETQTPFLHTSLSLPFPTGLPATLSQFLTGTQPPFGLANPGTITINDPISGVPRTYGDLLRRKADLQGLLGSSCRAGAILTDISLIPVHSAD